MPRTTIVAIIVCGIMQLSSGFAAGQVGEPTGFDITLTQGSTVVAQHSVTCGPGGDLTQLKGNDSVPGGFTQIGTLTGPQGNAPIILKVVTSNDPMFRLLHIFVDVPISLQNIHAAGPYSLFNPASPDSIEVSLSNMTFASTTWALPMLVANNSFFTTFMRDQGGQFYELPQANAFNSYGNGVLDIQVPGERFMDSTAGLYSFSSTPGALASGTWTAIPNPGPNTTIHNGIAGGQPSMGAGYVFEIGLTMAIVGIPEPATAFLLLGGLALLIRRRR